MAVCDCVGESEQRQWLAEQPKQSEFSERMMYELFLSAPQIYDRLGPHLQRPQGVSLKRSRHSCKTPF